MLNYDSSYDFFDIVNISLSFYLIRYLKIIISLPIRITNEQYLF